MTLRNAVIVPLMYRSIEVMNTASGGQSRLGRTQNYANANTNYLSSNFNTNNTPNTRNNRSNTNVLNSFIVSGPSQSVERFKDFIHYIDKPVPVILIEVMVIEINKNAIIEKSIILSSKLVLNIIIR